MTLFTWVVIAVLVGLNGLYVAAEFAAVSVRRSRVRQMAAEGSAAARQLLPTLEEPHRLDRYIAACQVGITISSLVLGAYGQVTLAEALTPAFERLGGMQTVAAQSTSAAVVLIGLTIVQMVLGELVPKSLALQQPTRVALLTVYPMRWSERLLSWFIAILNGSGWAVLRLLGVQPAGHRHIHSPEEIRFLIAESREGGYLDTEEQRRLDHALALTQRVARELMVPRIRIAALDVSMPLLAAMQKAVAEPYTRFPVYQDSLDNILGVVHTKDLAAVRFNAVATDSLRSLAGPILAVHEQVSVDRVLSLMREKRGVMSIVVDDFGGTSGLITTEDILSELLGEIGDEFKHPGEPPRRLRDGSVRLPGDFPLYDAHRWIGSRVDADSDTIGGLVAEKLGRLPQPGDVIEVDGVQIQVEQVRRRAVQSVLVRPIPGERKSGD